MATSLIHPQSLEATKSELDVFTIPATQAAIIGNNVTIHHPIAALDNSPDIEFFIPGTDDYIDMNSILLEVTCKVTGEDGRTAPTAAIGATQDKYAYLPAKYTLHSMFKSVDLYLNGVRVTQGSPTYPYRAFLDAILYTSKAAQETHMTAAMFDSQTSRAAAFDRGAGVTMIGPLHLDLCMQGKFLPNFLPVRIKLTAAQDSFVIIRRDTTANYRLVITKCNLYVRKFKLSPTTDRALSMALEGNEAKYFFTRTEIRSFHITAAEEMHSEPHLFDGVLPRKFVLGFVKTAAFNGNYSHDPYLFLHNEITEIAAFVNDTRVPSIPYTPSFDTSTGYMREYYALYEEMNMNRSEPSMAIARDAFKSKYPFFVFNLSPDRTDGPECGIMNPERSGNVRLQIRFKSNTSVAEQVTGVVYAHYDSLLQIDSDRQVRLSY